ncbi:MAG: ABC transporter substrate-binding protein, partial [Alphaproteobacteria bacterium]|nr:ABC transporter substrate-binding protein [Alphaproteobacteria bacterium]
MLRQVVCAVAALVVSAGAARAEVEEIAAAQQFGVAFLPMMLMERDQLVEKHARAAGLAKLKVDWPRVAGPSVMNDGLISGTMQFAALGAPSLITLWSKTRGNIGVRGMAAMTSYPLSL